MCYKETHQISNREVIIDNSTDNKNNITDANLYSQNNFSTFSKNNYKKNISFVNENNNYKDSHEVIKKYKTFKRVPTSFLPKENN